MPLNPLPPTIELTDFSGGVVPKAEEIGVPPSALLGAVNLMLDPVTGSVVTRKGTARTDAITGGTALDGYRLYSINPYSRGKGNRYLICVFSTNEKDAPNNIRVYAYVLEDPEGLHAGSTFFRLDTAGRVWGTANGRHWGATIDGTYYGGGEGDKMYSWNPTKTPAWNADPGTPVLKYPTWREEGPAGPGVARDYAFKAEDGVTHTYTKNGTTFTEYFQAKKDIRYDKWDAKVKKYRKGNRVSTTYAVDTDGAYWRSWECVDTHEPKEENKPGSGAGMWKKVRLMAPTNEDGDLNAKAWDRIPDAPKTHIAVWQGNRLFARNDMGIGGKQTLLYSRLAKVFDKDNVGKDRIGKAGNPQWDPDDWRAGGEDGAGFIPFETREGDNIEAIVPFGYYTLVFKRYSTHVISGLNPATWTIRQLADVGCIYSRAVTEHEGWLYFMSDRGLYRTDGTQVTPVPGSEKIDAWLREAVNWDYEPRDIELRSYDGLVWIALPTDGRDNNLILVYEPQTMSFWPQDLPVQTMAIARRKGRDRLFFASVNHEGTTSIAAYAWLGDKHTSASTKTIGGVTTTNYITNPGFQEASQWGNPVNWAKTDFTIKLNATKEAARRGKFGIELENTRTGAPTEGSSEGYAGMHTSTVNPPAGTYTLQVVVRRASWEKHPKKKPPMKFWMGGSHYDPQSTYLGDGWYKMWTPLTVPGSTEVGIHIAPGSTVHVDNVIFSTGTGPLLYFDGNGGEKAGGSLLQGNQRPYLLQYDHENAIDEDGNYTDDDQANSQGTLPINWFARTAWLTFGALQEERRIRRIWGLVRANGSTVGIRTFRNFTSQEDGRNMEEVDPNTGVVYNEGELPGDCHSIQVAVEGSHSPASLLGIALDTEPRRIRFGRR